MQELPDSKVSSDQKVTATATTPRNDPAHGAVTLNIAEGNADSSHQISKKSAADLCGQLLELLASAATDAEQTIQAAGLKLQFANGREWPQIAGEAWDEVASRFATPWKDLEHHDQVSIKRIIQAAGKKPAPPAEDQGEGLTRLSVNLNPETAEILKRISEDTGLTFTELVRRAIGIYKHLDDEVAQGRKIQTMDASGHNKREVILTGR